MRVCRVENSRETQNSDGVVGGVGFGVTWKRRVKMSNSKTEM